MLVRFEKSSLGCFFLSVFIQDRMILKLGLGKLERCLLSEKEIDLHAEINYIENSYVSACLFPVANLP